MAAINDSVKGIWNEWKRLYDTSTDPTTKKISLENLRAIDIADDGQKNNSLDNSLNIWDIQDPGSGTGGSGSGSGTGGSGSGSGNGGSGSGSGVGGSGSGSGTGGSGSGSGVGGSGDNVADFDRQMNDLPHELVAKLHEWFGGHDKVINTDSERAETLAYIKSKAGTDNVLSEAERVEMNKELDTFRGQWDQLYRLLQQLPEDVQSKIREKFDGANDWFDASEIADALEYIESKIGTNPNPTAAEIEALRKDLGV